MKNLIKRLLLRALKSKWLDVEDPDDRIIVQRMLHHVWNALEESSCAGKNRSAVAQGKLQEHVAEIARLLGYPPMTYTGEMSTCPKCGALYEDSDTADGCCATADKDG